MQMSLFVQPWSEVAILRRKKKRGSGAVICSQVDSPTDPGKHSKSLMLTCPFGSTNRGGTAAPSVDTASNRVTKTSESNSVAYLSRSLLEKMYWSRRFFL